MPDQTTTVEVGGRRLRLSNLDKVLYPASGFTKAEVIDYYVSVASALLPHVRDRPVSFVRFPDGVDAPSFFAKNAPQGTPEWVRTVTLPVPGSSLGRDTLDYVLVADLPTLVWSANLAALEIHIPQWRVGPQGDARQPDLIVFDLDPGPPATIVECCVVAHLLREALSEDGLTGWPKTSGRKGLQVYVPIAERPAERTAGYARGLAQRLEREHPGLVVHRMTRSLRPGKVLVDWSQNNAAKTTVAPYSLRGWRETTVSTPLTWEEVQDCESPDELVFHPEDVVERVRERGDLMEPLLSTRQRLG